MKSIKVILFATLLGSVAIIGCGDDDGNGGGNGNGDASSVCAECDVQTLEAIEMCENFYVACLNEDAGSGEECAPLARQRCGA